MFFLRKGGKKMIVLVCLSAILALAIDTAMQAPRQNTGNDGEAMTLGLNFDEARVIEAGFWDKFKDLLGDVIQFVQDVYDCASCMWYNGVYECGSTCWSLW